ncbi:MAG: hypothetical protein IPO38_00020 [Rhodocyclaceae bacterium]|nr:hypothetical protein [Rhodocyclaceae bacterium]MBL0075534.1 hypothetical protein [Rhodocyclaceae bacterium]
MKAAFMHFEGIFQSKKGSPEADEMKVLVTLIEAYENKHYAIEAADSVEATKFHME